MSTNSEGSKSLGRRDFLKISAGVGATAVVGYALSEYTPWQNYTTQADEIRKTEMNTTSEIAKMKDIVRYATLAANGHNTQPWKFAIMEKSIEIHPDFSRHLAVVDPDDREMWISLGCALENLLIAARTAGYDTEVTYPSTNDFIDVAFTPGSPQKTALYDAIPARQNTRSEYDGTLISVGDMGQIENMLLEPGIGLEFATNPEKLEMFVEYVNQGNLEQYADKAFLDELIFWLRFTKKEAISSRDGLFSRCSGNPAVPRWLGESFVSGTKPEQQADTDAKKLRSSAGAVVITSDSDDEAGWVRTGQVYERMALQMTVLDIKSAFLNQPIELGHLRSQFQQALGLKDSKPQLLVRFGYADALPYSLRRTVDDVLV